MTKTLEEAPVKQINPEEEHAGFMYTPSEIDTMVQIANQFSFPYEKLKTEPTNLARPGPSLKGQSGSEWLPTYEEMMFQDTLECGPSSMETQPDLDISADLEQVTLQEYLFDASKPLHTHFVLSQQGSTCPKTPRNGLNLTYGGGVGFLPCHQPFFVLWHQRCVLWQFGKPAERFRRLMQWDSYQSTKSVGNLSLSLWISPYPETESNSQKPEQSVPKLSQDQGDAMWLFLVDSSKPQTQLCA